MNHITISQITAVSALRDIRSSSKTTINYINECILNNQKLNKKIDILVTNKNKVYKDKLFQRHVSKNKLIKKSLLMITKNISVTSPELTIVQLASKLNYYELALLVLEFCGNYSIANDTAAGFINDIMPITSVERIHEFVEQYSKDFCPIKGLKNLKEILAFASDYSNSPMESRLFIKLCGPKSKGLYGCKGLELNKRVSVSDSASKIAGQKTIIPDISNKLKRVAIEYDSAQFHENTEQGQRDKRRRDALVKDG